MPQNAAQNEKKVLAAAILRRERLPLQSLDIAFHPSVRDITLEQEAAEPLLADRIDPKFLYVTPRQAELWRQVFLKHSPIHANPEFARIYRDAFAQIAARIQSEKVLIVGLGCGTGLKECDLYSHLKARGCEAMFSAVDVNYDLVVESVQKLSAAGAGHGQSLVCDLNESDFISGWLDRSVEKLPRMITFFGLVPNLTPSTVIRLSRSVLRPGDVLLASAHLAPVGEGTDVATAMERVLPQYDNPETLAWLTAALEALGREDQLEPPEMKIGEMDGVPAFIATARWKSGKASLQLFHSLRYTPSLFEEMLRNAGFEMERLAMTSCREEAIWAVCQRPRGAIFQPPPT